MQAPAPVVHEAAEIHRQHVRLRIPIGVEIDGTRYTVDDWSIGGFGVAERMTAHKPGDRLMAGLFFPFEDFELTLSLECQIVYIDLESPRFGCRFLGLSQGQASLFRYIVDAYLSGELVAAGDILAVLAQDNAAEARVQRLFGALATRETRGRRLRRLFGYLLFLLAGLLLAGLVAAGLYERYVITTDQAAIVAPFYRLTASSAGTVEAGAPGLLHPGDAAARLRGANGAIVPVPSPCECVLDEWHVPPGQVAQAGQAIATLVAADQPLTVRAYLPFETASRLRVGQAAEITVPGKEAPYQGRIERIDFKLRPEQPGTLPQPGDERLIPVILRPDRPFDFDNLGYIVRVRFLGTVPPGLASVLR